MATSTQCTIVLTSPADTALLGDYDRSLLLLQGFRGDFGQMAVTSHDEPKLYIGLGESHPTPRLLSEALRSLPVSLPYDVDVEFPRTKQEVDQTALTDAVATCVAERGGSPVWLRPGDEATNRAQVVGEALELAKTWTNLPAKESAPISLANRISVIAEEAGLGAFVLTQSELRDRGFNSILSVGAGSPHPPCLLHLHYQPKKATKRHCFVGKGITFDTGGLSLKSPEAQMVMRMDKAGASAAAAGAIAAARLGLQVEVHAILPLAENMIGPDAIRPGDRITSLSSKEIQILDTDFEGRVLLSDALTYASDLSPDSIVDLATLTYQSEIALGPRVAALLSNSQDLVEEVLESSIAAGEYLWQLPLVEEYRSQVRTSFGVKNHPEQGSGRAITAALFLQEFVPPTTKWAHIDMTGPAWSGPASADGATGFGVRTLVRFAERSQN